MSLHAQPPEAIPDLTRRIAQTSFPRGSQAMHLRDALGPIYQDVDFAHLFPERRRAAEAPWRLAMVTILQAIENLSDRQAAEMVRVRLDWKYALSLPMDDEGFDASSLMDFRQRLLEHHAEDLLLEPILRVCREQGLLKAGGKQRTDATTVLATVGRLSSLESVWGFDLYVYRFELQRFPKGKQAQVELLEQMGQDGWVLLQAVQAPEAVRGCSLIAVSQQVWQQHFELVKGRVKWRDGPNIIPFVPPQKHG